MQQLQYNNSSFCNINFNNNFLIEVPFILNFRSE